jgi:hypothetical protein
MMSDSPRLSANKSVGVNTSRIYEIVYRRKQKNFIGLCIEKYRTYLQIKERVGNKYAT